MAVPTIPQRPTRSQNIDIPSIPARPRRSMDRSISPNRDPYPRSPLNDPSFLHQKPLGPSHLSQSIPRDVPARPPSVTLPTVGQEGNEYAHLEAAEESDPGSTIEQKKTIAENLPLHAPKASLPVSAAKARIQSVTRTDSNTAAAVGIGKPSSENGNDNGHPLSRSVSSQQHSRPSSIYKPDSTEPEEQGIPEIGMQIPLYKMAGDVQAPTPAASQPPPSTGIGFFNKGDVPQAAKNHLPQAAKNHYRSKSGREVFHGPPGSYGMHGHGINKADPLEKMWYERNPQARAREAQGEYGPKIPVERKDYNLSSAELNKIIHEPSVETPGKISISYD
jgi:Altered inheritance of mitochondria protein 21